MATDTDTDRAAPALRFEGVGVAYPGAAGQALQDVSLEVARGELVVLLGPSGCGKTTLLKTVNRLVTPDSGRVLLEGADVRAGGATALRRRIGYVIQATGLFPHLTVAQNIGLVPGLLNWEARRTRERVDELLALVKLPADYGSRYPRQLSGGEAQRVGIARALAADPAFLLMDEPFGAIDAIARDHLQEALLEIQSRLRKTILFVTHDVDEALRLADRIAVLRAGRLVQVATPLDLLSRPADAFVRELLGADDLFRRLGLLRVRDLMAPPGDGAAAPGTAAGTEADTDATSASKTSVGSRVDLGPDDDLREALTALLRSVASELPVRDADGTLVGRLSLDALRRISRPGGAP